MSLHRGFRKIVPTGKDAHLEAVWNEALPNFKGEEMMIWDKQTLEKEKEKRSVMDEPWRAERDGVDYSEKECKPKAVQRLATQGPKEHGVDEGDQKRKE